MRRFRGYGSDERGAISVFFVILLPLLLVIGGVATDISLLNAQKTHVQGQADMAAQSAVMRLPDLTALRATARAVAAANDRNDGPALTDADIVIGTHTRAGGFVPAANQNSAAGVNAVEVTVPSPFRPMLLGAILSDEDLTIRRSAVAAQAATISFTLRNRLLSLQTNRSALDALLRDTLGISVSLLDYQGLATTQIGIKDLLGLVTANVNASAMTFADVLNADISVNTLLGRVLGRTVSAGTGTVKLGTLLSVSPEITRLHVGDVLPQVSVSALDLLVATATFMKNGKIATVTAGLDISPLASVKADISIGQAPVTVIGRVDDVPPLRAHVAQTSTALTANIAGGLVALSANARVADATATATSVNCNARGNETLATFSVTTGVAALGLSVKLLNAIGTFNPPAKTNTVPIISTTQPIAVTYAQMQGGVPVPASTAVYLSSVTSSLGGLLGSLQSESQAQKECGLLGLNCLVGALLGTLNSLISSLTSLLVQSQVNTLTASLLKALGVDVAPADVIVHSYACHPVLVR